RRRAARRQLAHHRRQLVEPGVLQRAKLRVHEGVYGRRAQHHRTGARARERTQLAHPGHGAGPVPGAEGGGHSADDGAEVRRADPRRPLEAHGVRTWIATSTKSCAPSLQRKARASPRVRASDTTTQVTSGYEGSSPNMARARSSPEKYAPVTGCE